MIGITPYSLEDDTRSAVLNRLVDVHGLERVTATQVAERLAQPGRLLLLFAGDPDKRPESADLAVILPELLSEYGAHLSAALIDSAHEAALMAQFGVVVTPTLVLVADGEVVSVLPRLRDWAVYRDELARFVATTGGANQDRTAERRES